MKRTHKTATKDAAGPRLVHLDTLSRITVGPRLRAIDEQKVLGLMDSIRALGLQTPITVAEKEGGLELVVGLHRLEATRRLGRLLIETFHIASNGGSTDRRTWEIAENLHRADLTWQERHQHVVEWLRIMEERGCADAHPSGGGRQPGSKGISLAARELGVDRTEVQRAVRIASLPAEAREIADAAGLVTQKARLDIAKAPIPVEKAKQLASEAGQTEGKRPRSTSSIASTRAGTHAASTSLTTLISSFDSRPIPVWNPPGRSGRH